MHCMHSISSPGCITLKTKAYIIRAMLRFIYLLGLQKGNVYGNLQLFFEELKDVVLPLYAEKSLIFQT